MKKTFIACLMVGLSSVSQGAFRYWYGSGDLTRPWTDPANWSDSTLPVLGDVVVLRSFGKPLVVSDDDAALASQLDYCWDINGAVGDDVVWNVSTNVEFHGTFANWSESAGKPAGRFFKRGAGDFNCVFPQSGGSVSSYKAPRWVVERGTFRYPQFGATPPFGNASAGTMSVSNGATVVTFACTDGANAVETTFMKLVCDGLLTNEVAGMTAIVHINSDPDDPSEVRGVIGGNIRLAFSGSVDLYGTGNTFPVCRPNGRKGATPQVIGVMDFGVGGSPSSLGLESGLYYDYNGPVYRYLGTGGTLAKNLYVRLHGEYASWDLIHPPSLDGGPFGGLELMNVLYANDQARNVGSLIVEGTNAAPCTFRSRIRIFASADGHYCPLHLIKRGSGTWNFPAGSHVDLNSLEYGMIGGLSIEEGTVRAETITDRGHASSLGTGTDCYGEYIGPYDTTKKVDWSISFGATNAAGIADKEGTLEYYGDLKGYSSNRKMVLLGNGRIRNASTNTLQMARILARTAGEKTLVLDGTNTGDNVVSEISDGTGRVSVTKEGSGRWILRGNQTFSGDLRVRAGTLEVQAPTDYFRWYRLTFLKMAETPTSNFVQPYKISFYDKDGRVIGLNASFPPPWTDYGDGGYGTQTGSNQPVTREFLEMPEPSGRNNHGECCGYFLPGRPGTYSWSDWSNCASYTWFTDSTAYGYTTYGTSLLTAEACEWTAYPIVIRMRQDLNPVAYYDVAGGHTKSRNPGAFLLEGSRDGVCWYELDRRDVTYPGQAKWYSDGTDWSTNTRTLGNGAGYSVTNNVAVSSLQNVRSVSVAEGATLRTTCANVGTIKGLVLDPGGAGTIDGFEFAETGLVSVDGIERGKRTTIPLNIQNSTTYGNVRGWNLSVNGMTDSNYSLGVTSQGITIYPPVMVIIIR